MENEIQVIEQTALTWPEKARQLVIKDQATYTTAANILQDIAAIEKRIIEHHKPIKDAAFSAHKIAVATERRFLDPLTEAKGIIKKAISTWTVEQERIRREAQQKAEDEARRKEEERRLAEAIEAEKAGDTVKAEAIISKPIEPVVVSKIQPTFNKVAGVTTRENWSAEVIDLKALCQAIAEGKAPLESVLPNMPLLNSMARTAKDLMSIPGVKAIKETNVVTR